MEIFYADRVDGNLLILGPDESTHCAKVLRHRPGDVIDVADGNGNLYGCRISSISPKEVCAVAESCRKGWGDHPYRLTMAVCPTKNTDRYEWFAEKAAEMGVDSIVPVIGEHSERRNLREDRLQRILLSAAKQSLKARLPELCPSESVMEFVSAGREGLKLVACCFEDGSLPRVSMKQAVEEYMSREYPCFHGGAQPYEDGVGMDAEKAPASAAELRGLDGHVPEITVLIGPEGDFSAGEVAAAISAGYLPVHLGSSRLRTETAAVFAVASVYELLSM